MRVSIIRGLLGFVAMIAQTESLATFEGLSVLQVEKKGHHRGGPPSAISPVSPGEGLIQSKERCE
jgi:hypothetical protein